MNALDRTRLEKAAADCGFELSPELVHDRLVLRSACFPESVSVEPLDNGVFRLRPSVPILLPEPVDTATGFAVHGWNALYEMLGKAAATARTMPNRVAQKFSHATATLPKSTDAERWFVQRVGQNLFRSALLDYWQGRCCVTGLGMAELLRASHIKPWAQCDSDEERLDVFNGLLLSPHLDALFDGGWVTFDELGVLVVASSLAPNALAILGLSGRLRIKALASTHQAYLNFHRTVVFKE